MLYAIIDCAGIASRAELHAQLAERLCLPEWYGGNLDALHDCLTDLSEPTCILLQSHACLQDALGDYAQRFLRVLSDCSGENPLLQVRLL